VPVAIDVEEEGEEEQFQEAIRRSQLESEVVEVSGSDDEDGNAERKDDTELRRAMEQSLREREALLEEEEEEDPELQEVLERSRLESEPAAQTPSVTAGRGGGPTDAGPGPSSVLSIQVFVFCACS
jgi:hypothetical protein